MAALTSALLALLDSQANAYPKRALREIELCQVLWGISRVCVGSRMAAKKRASDSDSNQEHSLLYRKPHSGELITTLEAAYSDILSPSTLHGSRVDEVTRDAELALKLAEEAAFGFAGSDAGLIRIEGLGFFAPDLISFTGRDIQGHRTTLIQHVSQLNVTLVASPKHVDQPEPTRIGFRLAQALERDDTVTT